MTNSERQAVFEQARRFLPRHAQPQDHREFGDNAGDERDRYKARLETLWRGEDADDDEDDDPRARYLKQLNDSSGRYATHGRGHTTDSKELTDSDSGHVVRFTDDVEQPVIAWRRMNLPLGTVLRVIREERRAQRRTT